MDIYKYKWIVLFVCMAAANVGIRRQGWLDRVVQYHKARLFADVSTLPPIEISASIQHVSSSKYVDSPYWDLASVIRLITLMKSSPKARPAYRALRRMLRPKDTRRLFMSVKDSRSRFPSLPDDVYYDEDEDGDVEYDGDSYEDEDTKKKEDNATVTVIVVSNPVESRLPSTRISVLMLREILEARARAARIMPTTHSDEIIWKPMNRTSPRPATNDTEGEGNSSTEAGGNDTETTDARGNDTDAPNGTEPNGIDPNSSAEPAAETTPPAEPTTEPAS